MKLRNWKWICIAYCHNTKSSRMRYCHRQSGRTAYRPWAGPALTGPDLRLTAIRSSGLPFNGRHLRDPCNYMDHFSFTDPERMEGWVGQVVGPTADTTHFAVGPTTWPTQPLKLFCFSFISMYGHLRAWKRVSGRMSLRSAHGNLLVPRTSTSTYGPRSSFTIILDLTVGIRYLHLFTLIGL